MLNRRLIGSDQMVVEEEKIPKPQPESFLFLLGSVFISAHIVEIARIDHGGTSDIKLIRRTPKILADLVQEVIELEIQLVHLHTLILFDIIERQPFDLLPFDTRRQAKSPCNIELLKIRIRLRHIDLIVPVFLKVSEECTHTRKIILHMAL